MSDWRLLLTGAPPSAPMPSESIVSRRCINGSPESAALGFVGEPGLWYPPGWLPESEKAVNPPEMVVEALRFDALVVLPQPRYPLESSAISEP